MRRRQHTNPTVIAIASVASKKQPSACASARASESFTALVASRFAYGSRSQWPRGVGLLRCALSEVVHRRLFSFRFQLQRDTTRNSNCSSVHLFTDDGAPVPQPRAG